MPLRSWGKGFEYLTQEFTSSLENLIVPKGPKPQLNVVGLGDQVDHHFVVVLIFGLDFLELMFLFVCNEILVAVELI